MQHVSRPAARILPRAKTVLVRDRGGIWSGLLSRWDRHPGGWYGKVTWDMMGQACHDVVHQDNLRPYEAGRPVDVCNVFGDWDAGLLLCWRRRAGIAYWEIEVKLGTDDYRGVIDWFSADRVRPREGLPYSDAF